GPKVLKELTHPNGGLVRQGNRQDLAGANALLNQVADPARDHACLAATGTGENKQWTIDMEHGLALRVGQIIEEGSRGRIHHALLQVATASLGYIDDDLACDLISRLDGRGPRVHLAFGEMPARLAIGQAGNRQ